MADFALGVTACETTFWQAGTFAQAMKANRGKAVEEVIEADPVAAAVRIMMANRAILDRHCFGAAEHNCRNCG